MASDIRFNGDELDVDGTVLFSGQIVSTHYEVTSRGPVAGFSFTDRSDFISGDGVGHRYVWYCQDQKARLWSGSDVITIGVAGDKASLTVGDLELVQAIKALQATTSYLQKEIDELRAKVGLPVIDWSKLIVPGPFLHTIPGQSHA
jgi:hypothetical protein